VSIQLTFRRWKVFVQSSILHCVEGVVQTTVFLKARRAKQYRLRLISSLCSLDVLATIERLGVCMLSGFPCGEHSSRNYHRLLGHSAQLNGMLHILFDEHELGLHWIFPPLRCRHRAQRVQWIYRRGPLPLG